MKTLALILLAALPVLAAPVTLREPARMFNGQWITLQPVFNWWTNAPEIERQNRKLPKESRLPVPPRPMPAWVHVSGRFVEASMGGWIVDATITVTPSSNYTARIFLQRPPEFARREYADAIARADTARANKQAANTRAARANSRAEVAKRARDDANFEWSLSPRLWPDASIRANRAAREVNYQRNTAANAERAAVNQAQIEQAYASKATQFGDLGGNYNLDIFALRTGAMLRGLPVYDVGILTKVTTR